MTKNFLNILNQEYKENLVTKMVSNSPATLFQLVVGKMFLNK